MTQKFNVSEVSYSLIQSLEKELGNNCLIRLSLDVQLPAQLVGDWESISESIKCTCEFLVHHLVNGVVDIEIVKIGQHNGHITIGVYIKGSDFINSRNIGIRKVITEYFLGPHSIKHNVNITFEDDYLKFSFKTKFDLATESIKQSAAPHAKILVVEDNELNALVFSSFLESWEINVTIVANGEEAISKLKHEPFDMVLMDIHMPILNGIEATRQIRGFNTKVPIIVLTASSLETDLMQALSAGADDLLQKPVSSSQLYSIVIKYLGPIHQSE